MINFLYLIFNGIPVGWIISLKSQNLICGLKDCSELEDALTYVKNHEFSTYVSNAETIIESIERFIGE